jgi:uncharacterized protein (TIGR02301 family)
MAFEQSRRRSPFTKAATCGALAVALLAATPGLAQIPTPGQQPQNQASPEYESNVKNLAFVMGSLHFLRTTCGDANDQTWRLNMQSLLDREGAPGAPLRVGMINAFNDGFSEHKGRFPSCSAAAQSAQKSLGRRGALLSRSLARSNY